MTPDIPGQLRIDGSEVTPEEARLSGHANRARIDVDADFSDWFDSNELWPDDVPERWTARDVAEMLGRAYWRASAFVSEWDIALTYNVTITDDQGNLATVRFTGVD